MGCDIHGPWIERGPEEETRQWDFIAELDLNRNYALFALMASVRNYENITQGQPTFDAKGIPLNLSRKVESEYTLYVEPGDADAARWVEQGSSKVWSRDSQQNIRRITGPDWHSASWLSTAEVATLVERFAIVERAHTEIDLKSWKELRIKYGHSIDPIPPYLKPEFESEDLQVLRAALAMMQTLERPESPCRMVFWFDN